MMSNTTLFLASGYPAHTNSWTHLKQHQVSIGVGLRATDEPCFMYLHLMSSGTVKPFLRLSAVHNIGHCSSRLGSKGYWSFRKLGSSGCCSSHNLLLTLGKQPWIACAQQRALLHSVSCDKKYYCLSACLHPCP